MTVSLSIERAHLEIPLTDLALVASELGCRVSSREGEVTLHDGGTVVFDRVGPLAMLRSISIHDDENGLFAVHVLGRLLSAYEGELEATVETVPADLYPKRVSVRRGESAHPLFAAVMPPMVTTISPEVLARVETLLDEARAAWAQWQQHKRVTVRPTPSAPRR